jgi:outer membrane receptor protein involved in Fe transport
LDKISGTSRVVAPLPRILVGSMTVLALAASLGSPAAAQDALSAAAASASADADADLSELNLENLLRLKVITASGGVAESSDLAPANVYTVLASEIVNNGWRSVAEVLEHVPGLYVVDDYVTSNVAVRGASGGLRAGTRIMKVMINGTDVSFRPDSNALIGPEFIPIEVVERIEIARGPLSALYGANAFLATVNVVTIDPDRLGGQLDAHGSARPHNGGTSVGGGVAGVVTGRIGQHLKLLLSTSYDHIDRGGLRIVPTFVNQNVGNSPKLFQATPQGITQLPAISGTDLSRPISLFGRVTGATGDFGDVSLQGGLQQSDSIGNFQLGSVLTNRTREVLRNGWIEGQFNGRLTKMLSFSATAGFSSGAPTSNDRLYLTSAPTATMPDETYNTYFVRKFGYTAADGKLSVTVTPRTNLRLSGGVDVARESHDTLQYDQHYLADENGILAGTVIPIQPDNGPDNVTVRKIAPNLHASFDPIPSVRLSADGRVDFINLFDKQYSWRGAAGWRILPKLVVKVIGGRAFQTPSTVFLYAHGGFGSLDIQGSRIGNGPRLVPQVVTSYELVLNYLVGENLVINAAGYLQSISDQISMRANGTGFVAQNQGTADSYGGELNITARLWRLEPYARISKQVFQNHPTREEFDPGPVVPPPLVPAFWAMAGVRANVPSPHLTFDVTWRGVGERGASTGNIFLNRESYALPAYYDLVDVAATGSLPTLGKGRDARVTFAVRNVLDKTHSEPGFGGIDIPSMGRIFQLGLSQAF